MGALIEKRYCLYLLCILLCIMIMISCTNEFGQKQGRLIVTDLQRETVGLMVEDNSTLNCKLVLNGEKQLHVEFGDVFPYDMTKLNIKCRAKGNTLYIDEYYNGGQANGIQVCKVQFDVHPIVQKDWVVCIGCGSIYGNSAEYIFTVTLSKDKEIVTYFSDLK